MKLIDLLVQELPKQGGWPGSQYDGEVMKIDNICWSYKEGCYPTAYMNGETVRKSEYEAALAASQQSAWNGYGLPPVGCECEYTMNGGEAWWKCTINYIVGYSGLVMGCDCPGGEQYVHFESYNRKKQQLKFRPIRTEAERKREESISKIQSHAHVDFVAPISTGQAVALYDAIAAGKIPHITLK